MAKVYFIRHAETAVDVQRPPSEWSLTDAGRAAVQALAVRIDWSTVTLVAHSRERKAADTAHWLTVGQTVPCASYAGLNELAVPFIADRAELVARVGRYLSGYPDDDFEPRARALARFGAALDAIQAASRPGRAVVVSHGRILTVFMASLLGRALTVADWQSLAFPDIALVDLTARQVESGFFRTPHVTDG